MADYRKILVLLLDGAAFGRGGDRGVLARCLGPGKPGDADLAGWFPGGRRKVFEEYVRPEGARADDA